MIIVTINDQDHTVDVPADMPLLRVLRDVVGLIGTRFGCGIGDSKPRDWPCPPGTVRPRRV
jgi:aerobic-type carbon monoxide dehydrogenase small subunit (CoxS/CutS family)